MFKLYNKKNIATTLIGMLLTLPTIATAAAFEPATKTSSTHYYAGGQMGGNALQTRHETNTVTFGFNNDYRSAVDGFEGGLFAGIAWENHTYYVATEFHFDGATNKKKMHFQTSGTPITIEEQVPYTFGISIIPGIYLNDNTLVYLRGAVVFSKYKQNTMDGGVWSSPNTFDKLVTGYRGGMGIQADIDENLSIRLEYDYTRYSDFNDSGFSSNFSDTVNAKFKMSSHTALVGVVYRFS